MRIRRAAAERRTSADGHVFDSLSEMARWEELKLMQRAGEITKLERQPKFPLILVDRKGLCPTPVMIRSGRYPNGRPCTYTADFSYWQDGKRVVEEHKGFWTDVSRLRLAVAEAIYGFRAVITGQAKSRVKR